MKRLIIIMIAVLMLTVSVYAQHGPASWSKTANHYFRYLQGYKVVTFNIDGTALPDTANGNHSTGYTLPDNCIIFDMFFYVNTADDSSSMTIDIGDTSDYDGFADGVSMGSTGIVIPWATLTDSVWVSNTRGAYLSNYVKGVSVDTPGVFIPKPHSGSGGNLIYVTNKDTFPDFDVDVYFILKEF